MKKLILISVALPNSRVEFLPGDLPVVMGRSRQADFTINDEQLSRLHSEVRLNDAGDFLLVDLDSTNLTIVNEHDVSVHILRHGDRILLGNTEIMVEIQLCDDDFNEQTTREIRALPGGDS